MNNTEAIIKPSYDAKLTNQDLAPLKKQTWGAYNIFAFWMSDVHSVSDLCLKLQNELGVIVIDGVAAAVKQAEMLVQLNLKTSKVGDWASPPVKSYTGILSGFGAH